MDYLVSFLLLLTADGFYVSALSFIIIIIMKNVKTSFTGLLNLQGCATISNRERMDSFEVRSLTGLILFCPLAMMHPQQS